MLHSLKTNELEALIQVSTTINAHLDLDSVLEAIMKVTTDVLQVEASSLFLIDNETGELEFHVARGEKANAVKPIRMKAGEGVVGYVIRTGEAQIINDVSQDARFFSRIDEKSGFRTRSILCVPLETTKQLWGAIEVMNKSDGSDFDRHDMSICRAIASQAAIAIENAMLHKRIVKNERLAAIGQTIAGLAHCIKNVLNGIHGGSYMVELGMRKDNSGMMMKGWSIIKKNSTFIHDLVMDMLTYSKEREPEYEAGDVNEIIGSVCDLMESKAAETNTGLSWQGSPALDKVVLDPHGIKRCLLNLVSNAIDVCEEVGNGKVTLTASPINYSSFSISVSDNGSGIGEEDLGKLFQVFYSTKGSKGTGLGLAVTHKIVTEHGGTIDVESEPGRGTTFRIILPLKRDVDTQTNTMVEEK